MSRKEIIKERSIRNGVISIVVSLSIAACAFPQSVWAEPTEINDQKESDVKLQYTDNSYVINDASAITEGSARTVNDVISQLKFSQNTGHGFAAEQGNNFIDQIKGKNTIVVGDNNLKNGPDRLILGRDGSVIYIQDKYYNNANASIDACFNESGFRYIDGDGNLMQIEVPRDQYDKAVLRMKQKIEEGKVPGITDPEEAKNLVRKGNLTFEQAKNLAKAGTVESLTYDAAHGVVAAGGSFGISTLLNYAVLRVNGETREDAVKESAIAGVKAGIGVFCTAVIAGQLSKTAVMNVFKPSSEALTKALGEDFSKALLKAFGQKVLATEGESAAESATKQAAKLLRSEVLVAVVTTIVFSVPDAVDLFRGRISKKQFVKNFAVTATTVVAGTVGYGLGGAVGNLIVPGVGTVPGGIIGSLLVGTGGGFAADKIADYVTDDDAYEMYNILEEQFSQLCVDYLVNESEAQNIVDALDDGLDEDKFKDMYQSKDREGYSKAMLTPLFEKEVSKREKVDVPTEEEMRAALMEELEGIVYIH